MKERTQRIMEEFVQLHPALSSMEPVIWRSMEAIIACYHLGGKVITCGNGGSASDCEHIVGEFMKGFKLKRSVDAAMRTKLVTLFSYDGSLLADKLQRPVQALSLVNHTSLMTAICNDIDAEMIFAQQVYGYCGERDVLLAVSTSGNSNNVLNAVRVAKACGAAIIALTNRDGGKLAQLADITIRVPADETFLVQEMHLPVYHALCAMVESELFED